MIEVTEVSSSADDQEVGEVLRKEVSSTGIDQEVI